MRVERQERRDAQRTCGRRNARADVVAYSHLRRVQTSCRRADALRPNRILVCVEDRVADFASAYHWLLDSELAEIVKQCHLSLSVCVSVRPLLRPAAPRRVATRGGRPWRGATCPCSLRVRCVRSGQPGPVLSAAEPGSARWSAKGRRQRPWTGEESKQNAPRGSMSDCLARQRRSRTPPELSRERRAKPEVRSGDAMSLESRAWSRSIFIVLYVRKRS